MLKHYKVSEIAELLSVSHKTIRGLVRKGILRAVKIAGVIRVSEDCLQDYLNRNQIDKPLAKKPTAQKNYHCAKVKDYFADA